MGIIISSNTVSIPLLTCHSNGTPVDENNPLNEDPNDDPVYKLPNVNSFAMKVFYVDSDGNPANIPTY